MEKKSFWSQNNKALKKLWATHFVMCIFGLMTYLPFNTEPDANGKVTAGWWLALFAGIVAILFLFYLIDLFIWEVGAKEQLSREANTMNGMKGFIIGLIVAIPDIVIGVLYLVINYFARDNTGYEWAINPAFIISLITVTWESMFAGLKATIFSGFFPPYYLIVSFVPVIFTGFSYWMGTKQKAIIPRPKRKSE